MVVVLYAAPVEHCEKYQRCVGVPVRYSDTFHPRKCCTVNVIFKRWRPEVMAGALEKMFLHQ